MVVRNLFFLLISLVFFSSCLREKVVIDNLEPKYPFSVTCFLEKSTPNGIRVKVSRTRKVFGPDSFDSSVVFDAKVFIRNGQDEIELVFDQMAQVYQAFPPAEFFLGSENYSLRVKWRDYPEALGKVQLPDAYELTSEQLQGQVQQYSLTNAPGPQYKFQCVFPDQLGKRNFYRILPLLGYSVPNQPLADTFFMPMYSNSIHLVSDDGIDGKLVNWTYTTTSVYPMEGLKVVAIKFGILNVDENYYRFHRAMEFANSGEELVEPYFVPNSFSNAYGVFASCNGYSEKTFGIE